MQISLQSSLLCNRNNFFCYVSFYLNVVPCKFTGTLMSAITIHTSIRIAIRMYSVHFDIQLIIS